jgi:hypothetical protein
MIRDYFAQRLAQNITDKSIKEALNAIARYIDANSNILLTLDMSKRYSFADKDRAVMYNLAGIAEEEMEEQIKLSKDIYTGNKKQSNPFYATTILCVYQVLKMSKSEKEKDTIAINFLTYMSFMMYVSIHKGLFKYAPNKEIMDYTIAHLDQSFKISSMPSILAFLEDNTRTAYTTYKNKFIRCNDVDIRDLSDAFYTRIKGKLKKIAKAWYDNWEHGRYLNADSDSFSEDDYHEMDNNSYAIARLTSRVHLKLIDRRFDRRFLKYAISSNDISLQKLTNLLEDILQNDDDNNVKKFISSLIEYYLLTSGKGYEYIGKGDFITYMKSAYASNTTVPQMVLAKNILDLWVDENMSTSGRARYGKTAKAGYKKALYMFFIFIINQEAKSS